MPAVYQQGQVEVLRSLPQEAMQEDWSMRRTVVFPEEDLSQVTEWWRQEQSKLCFQAHDQASPEVPFHFQKWFLMS